MLCVMSSLFRHRVLGDRAYHDPPERKRHAEQIVLVEESKREICTCKDLHLVMGMRAKEQLNRLHL